MATHDPLSAVNQYLDAFNKGDGNAMAPTSAVPGSILDGMAPHIWQGNEPKKPAHGEFAPSARWDALQSNYAFPRIISNLFAGAFGERKSGMVRL